METTERKRNPLMEEDKKGSMESDGNRDQTLSGSRVANAVFATVIRGEDRKLSVSALSNLPVVSINYLVIKLNTNNNNSMKLAFLFLL